MLRVRKGGARLFPILLLVISIFEASTAFSDPACTATLWQKITLSRDAKIIHQLNLRITAQTDWSSAHIACLRPRFVESNRLSLLSSRRAFLATPSLTKELPSSFWANLSAEDPVIRQVEYKLPLLKKGEVAILQVLQEEPWEGSSFQVTNFESSNDIYLGIQPRISKMKLEIQNLNPQIHLLHHFQDKEESLQNGKLYRFLLEFEEEDRFRLNHFSKYYTPSSVKNFSNHFFYTDIALDKLKKTESLRYKRAIQQPLSSEAEIFATQLSQDSRFDFYQKISALLNWVLSFMRYEYNRNPLDPLAHPSPRLSSEVCQMGTGICVDHATLLIRMMQLASIENAYPALLNRGSLTESEPVYFPWSVNTFNHAVVAVQDPTHHQWIYIDPTSDTHFTPPNISFDISDRDVLILDAEPARLHRTPKVSHPPQMSFSVTIQPELPGSQIYDFHAAVEVEGTELQSSAHSLLIQKQDMLDWILEKAPGIEKLTMDPNPLNISKFNGLSDLIATSSRILPEKAQFFYGSKVLLSDQKTSLLQFKIPYPEILLEPILEGPKNISLPLFHDQTELEIAEKGTHFVWKLTVKDFGQTLFSDLELPSICDIATEWFTFKSSKRLSKTPSGEQVEIVWEYLNHKPFVKKQQWNSNFFVELQNGQLPYSFDDARKDLQKCMSHSEFSILLKH